MCVYAELLQLCPTFCDSMDYSLAGSSVHGILQAKILEWVAIPSTRGSSWLRDQTCVSSSFCMPGGSLTLMPPGKHTFTATSRLVRWTSLAVHWLRLRFQCGGWRFKPWLGNQDPTYCRVPPPLQKKKTTKKPVFDWMTGDCWLAEMTHHRTTTGISHTKW